MPSERYWGSTEDGEIEFESLTEETLEGAVEVIRESFFRYESVSKAVEMTKYPEAMKELEELCLCAAKDGVSIVAVEISTGKVVAVAFNKIQVLPENGEKAFFEAFSDNAKHAASKCLVDFMLNVDSRVNLFDHYNVRRIFEIMFLATLSSYQRQRIGELVFRSSIELATELRCGKNVKTPVKIDGVKTITSQDVVPELVSVICTSNHSYSIARNIGLETLATVNYDEFEFAGKKFSERIGEEHKCSRLAAKRIGKSS